MNNIKDTVAKIEKRFGKEAIAGKQDNIKFLDTGSIKLNKALGGGWAKGRIVEVYGWESSGKSTLALHAAANCQKEGKVVVYIDAEHALDETYANALGVDTSGKGGLWYLVQPSCGEEGLEIAMEFARCSEVGIIIVDSTSALIPKSIIDGEAGDAKMAVLARLMSQMIPKFINPALESGCVVFFINQLREKVGVMFGCFQYNSRVVLEDGTTEKIGKIVNQKLPVRVMSYNSKTGVCEPKKIKNYFSNGKAEKFYSFKVGKRYGNGVSQFKCTPNHLIFTPKGEVEAESISVGDKVLSKDVSILSNIQKEIIYGSLLGDGSIKKRGYFCIGHGEKQIEYCKWKQRYFDNICTKSGYTNSVKGWNFETKRDYYLTSLRNELYKGGGRHLTESFLNKFTELSLAIWFMDDASLSGSYKKNGVGKVEISVQSYSKEGAEKIIKMLNCKFGLYPKLTKRNIILFSGEQSKKIQQIVCPFIPNCMEYKLIPMYRGKYVEIPVEYEDSKNIMSTGVVLEKREVNQGNKGSLKSFEKFDIEVEDNHNYIVDGVLVHNSPETTQGGNALKFYASQRVKIAKSGTGKDKEDNFISIGAKCKVEKNKVAPPLKVCKFDIAFGKGIDKLVEIIEIAEEAGVIEKKGSWYSYSESKLGQGRDSVVKILEDNPELVEEIKMKIELI